MGMAEPTANPPDSPSLRQRLHSATGDRHAEAETLSDRAGDEVDDAEAEVAVRTAHGDIRSDVLEIDGASQELATTDDARTVHDRTSKG